MQLVAVVAGAVRLGNLLLAAGRDVGGASRERQNGDQGEQRVHVATIVPRGRNATGNAEPGRGPGFSFIPAVARLS